MPTRFMCNHRVASVHNDDNNSDKLVFVQEQIDQTTTVPVRPLHKTVWTPAVNPLLSPRHPLTALYQMISAQLPISIIWLVQPSKLLTKPCVRPCRGRNCSRQLYISEKELANFNFCHFIHIYNTHTVRKQAPKVLKTKSRTTDARNAP